MYLFNVMDRYYDGVVLALQIYFFSEKHPQII